MKNYFNGEEKLEIGQFLFNYITNELVISEKEQGIIKIFLNNGSNELFGHKTIKPENVRRVLPYDENDNNRLEINLNEVDENTNCEKHLVVILEYNGNDFILRVVSNSKTVIELETDHDNVECVYRTEDKIVDEKAGISTFSVKDIKDNKVTEIVISDVDVSLDRKSSIYQYKILLNDKCIASKLIQISGDKDKKGRLYPVHIVKRLNIIHESLNSGKYEKTKKQKGRKKM